MSEHDELLDELAGVDASAAAEVAPATPEPEKPVEATITTAAEMEELRVARADAESKLKALQEGLAKQIQDLRSERQAEKAAAAKPVAPDFMQDPEGSVKFLVAEKEEQFTRALAEMRNKSDDERNQMAQQLFQTRIATAESQFVQQTPDYYDALNYVRGLRAKELVLLGAPQDKIGPYIASEEMQLGVQAMNLGKHPAQVAYERAKVLGYSGSTGTAKAPDTLEADEQAERRAKAERAQSMGGGGTPDLDTVLDADEDLFSEAFQELLGAKLH